MVFGEFCRDGSNGLKCRLKTGLMGELGGRFSGHVGAFWLILKEMGPKAVQIHPGMKQGPPEFTGLHRTSPDFTGLEMAPEGF